MFCNGSLNSGLTNAIAAECQKVTKFLRLSSSALQFPVKNTAQCVQSWSDSVVAAALILNLNPAGSRCVQTPQLRLRNTLPTRSIVRMTHRLASVLLSILFSCAAFAGLHFTANPFSYPVGTNPVSLAVADVNLDGWPDCVVANSADTFVSVLTNRGDGVFATATSIPLDSCTGVITDDVNGDGAPDIIALRGRNFIVMTNTSGGFAVASSNTFFQNADRRGFLAMDVNGDGWKEVLSVQGGPLQVFTNDHEGTFSFWTNFFLGGFYPWAMVPGDFNNDGLPDLLVNHVEDLPTLVTNNGNGILTRGPLIAGYGNGGTPLAADMNHDGLIDVLLNNTLLTNSGAGTFLLAHTNIAGTSDFLQNAADLNNDGWPEALVLGDSGSLKIRTNDHSNVFSTAAKLPAGALGFVNAKDVNSDGLIDLIYGKTGSLNISLQYSNVSLAIERAAPNSLIVSWPFTEPRTHVQSATNLSPTPINWTLRSPSTNVSLRRLELLVPASKPMEFFIIIE
jgi:hypothetical protein